MAFAFPSANTQNIFPIDNNKFYSVVNQLKARNALPHDCFLGEVPFFNLPSLPKEMQIKELFENSCDAHACKHLLKNVAPLVEGAEHKFAPQNYSSVSVMSIAQIVLYKVLPCPHGNCPNYPREIATHNQYKDFEYECPFHHHEKDRRRMVLFDDADEEFTYKANYFEEGRRRGEKEKYSQNYFESMFHPLYYKMFRCKRSFCNQSAFCPFFHSEEEKNTWDNTFSSFLRKDRVSYVKDKPQKTAEKKPRGPENRRRLSSEEETSPQESQGLFNNKHTYNKQYMNQKAYQQCNQQNYFELAKNNFEKNWKNPVMAYRKDSDSSFEESHGNNGFFSKLQAASMGYDIY